MARKPESKAEREARHGFYEEVLGKGRCFFKTMLPHSCQAPGQQEIIDPMHFLAKQNLEQVARLRGYDDKTRIAMKWDARNGAPGCRPLHNRMDNGFLRIYQSQLPGSVMEFVDDWDLHNLLDRKYPEGEPPHEQ